MLGIFHSPHVSKTVLLQTLLVLVHFVFSFQVEAKNFQQYRDSELSALETHFFTEIQIDRKIDLKETFSGHEFTFSHHSKMAGPLHSGSSFVIIYPKVIINFASFIGPHLGSLPPPSKA